jgi:hypothetical protein
MPKRNNGKYVPKTLTVREDQAKFIEKTSLNLSKFVQKKLDELMK